MPASPGRASMSKGELHNPDALQISAARRSVEGVASSLGQQRGAIPWIRVPAKAPRAPIYGNSVAFLPTPRVARYAEVRAWDAARSLPAAATRDTSQSHCGTWNPLVQGSSPCRPTKQRSSDRHRPGLSCAICACFRCIFFMMRWLPTPPQARFRALHGADSSLCYVFPLADQWSESWISLSFFVVSCEITLHTNRGSNLSRKRSRAACHDNGASIRVPTRG